jgi:hypothetical protein
MFKNWPLRLTSSAMRGSQSQVESSGLTQQEANSNQMQREGRQLRGICKGFGLMYFLNKNTTMSVHLSSTIEAKKKDLILLDMEILQKNIIWKRTK